MHQLERLTGVVLEGGSAELEQLAGALEIGLVLIQMRQTQADAAGVSGQRGGAPGGGMWWCSSLLLLSDLRGGPRVLPAWFMNRRTRH